MNKEKINMMDLNEVIMKIKTGNDMWTKSTLDQKVKKKLLKILTLCWEQTDLKIDMFIRNSKNTFGLIIFYLFIPVAFHWHVFQIMH